MNDDMKQKMSEQEHMAKKIIEGYTLQARWD